MKSIKEHFSEYGFLSLLVVPVFFVISYLFNVVYFFAFGVSLSQIPLAVSDYIMSVNTFGVILLFGIILQSLIVIPAQYFENKLYFNHSNGDSNFRKKVYNLRQLINDIKCCTDDEDIKIKKIQQAENDFKTIEEDSSNVFQRIDKKITIIKIILFIASLLSISLFIYLTSKYGLFHAKFILITFPFLCIGIFTCKHFDTLYLWLIVTSFTCLTYSLDDALIKALENYKNDSVDVITYDNKYFNMRSFENGFWVKKPETGEVLFITKAGDILNFHQPKRIIKHLEDEKHD